MAPPAPMVRSAKDTNQPRYSVQITETPTGSLDRERPDDDREIGRAVDGDVPKGT